VKRRIPRQANDHRRDLPAAGPRLAERATLSARVIDGGNIVVVQRAARSSRARGERYGVGARMLSSAKMPSVVRPSRSDGLRLALVSDIEVPHLGVES
jgi:hypothetical protein